MLPNGPIEVEDAKGSKSGGQSGQGRGREGDQIAYLHI